MKAYLKKLGSIALLAGAVATCLSIVATPAKAWSGCGVGANAGMLWIEDIKDKSIGGSVLCDVKAGALVFGAFVDYSMFLGDLKDVNATDLTIGGRGGFLLNPTVLVYAHLGWSRLDTDFGNVDGTKIGGGIEVKLPDVPGLYLDARYTNARYSDSGTDFSTDGVRLGLVFKFEATAKQLESLVPQDEPVKPAPKKAAAAKKQ